MEILTRKQTLTRPCCFQKGSKEELFSWLSNKEGPLSLSLCQGNFLDDGLRTPRPGRVRPNILRKKQAQRSNSALLQADQTTPGEIQLHGPSPNLWQFCCCQKNPADSLLAPILLRALPSPHLGKTPPPASVSTGPLTPLRFPHATLPLERGPKCLQESLLIPTGKHL